ncbi:hypothetical protein AK812_SmicGene4884 [Symbiodinium microadriaticum]|uniref:HPP transmembrane region domain-containing protein n=1 Tax=Symbiodinium microadriaticum TaxID=2951 RepID=A0A1Q9EV70_SYMMI|nr:hypothetical protein AK812_SmicGene4884 [Symbiodinium microadriaticum]
MADPPEPLPAPSYCKKMLGAGQDAPAKVSMVYSVSSFVGAFLGMGAIGLLHNHVMMPYASMVLLVGSFGAMSVIIFSGYKTAAAQPKNVILGNTLGGLVGVVVCSLMTQLGLEKLLWLSAAISVSLTILAQEVTRSVHPPGGATALLYILTPAAQDLGYWFIFCPCFLGAVILVAVGCVTNNLAEDRIYPQYWWPRASTPSQHAQDEKGPESSDSEQEAARVSKILCYFRKFLGAGAAPLPTASPPLNQTWCSLLGSFLAIASLGLLEEHLIIPQVQDALRLMVAAFGAMSVIIFSAWNTPFAQPKNAIVGNTLGGFVGVAVYHLFLLAGIEECVVVGAALCVSLTIFLQELTNSVHPPGGATALLYVIVSHLQKSAWMYIFTPAFLGSVILVLIGCLTNNLAEKRRDGCGIPAQGFRDCLDATNSTYDFQAVEGHSHLVFAEQKYAKEREEMQQELNKAKKSGCCVVQ